MMDTEAILSGLIEVSCLKSTSESSISLCKKDGERFIVKATDSPDGASLLRNEYELLLSVAASRHPQAKAFPRAVAFRDHPPYTLILTFIPGHSLETLVEAQPDHPGLPREKAIQYTLAVLDQLACLHGMKPPVIHRDIKPQNVIVDENGACHLIDLGISRVYRPEARRGIGGMTDTRVIGTRLTAPPEQFGYRQTDERSDIYSAGVLLRYCLTGEYTQDADQAIDPGLRVIVRKATAFDPDSRYQNVRQMTAALKRQSARKKRGMPRWTLPALLIFLALAGLVAWVLTGGRPAPYRFREPLIEQAVRMQLNRPEGDLFPTDLEQVESIHIIGRQIYDSEDQIWFMASSDFIRDEAMREAGLWQENGGIASLEDVKALPGLRELCLYRQQISDISALWNTGILRVGIGENPLTDLSPLANNQRITYLNLNSLDIDPLDVLVTLPALDTLVACGVRFSSFDGLQTLPLEEVSLYNADNGVDWGPLGEIPTLKRVTIDRLDRQLLNTLRRLEITELTVADANGIPLHELSSLSELTDLYYYQTGSASQLLDDSPSFPKLQWLDVKNIRVESLACFSGMPALSILNIYASEVVSYDGLETLPSLESIFCTEEQALRIREQYPALSVELHD